MATFTLTGTFAHQDAAQTPIVNTKISIAADPYPLSTKLLALGKVVETDANGQINVSMTTGPAGLYYVVRSLAKHPVFLPIRFLAPASGTIDISSLIFYNPSGTPPLQQDLVAIRDAALAAVASVAVSTWQANTSVVANQVVKAPPPDGSEISSNSSRTTRATFDATEQANWTPVVAKAGTMAKVALDAANDARYPQKGATFYNVADFATLSAALAAIPDGATLFLPPGTYAANQITTLTKNVVIQGAGNRLSIIDAGANTYGFTLPADQAPIQATFRDVGFKGSTSGQVRLVRDVQSQVTFTDCRFSGFAANAIENLGTNIHCTRCEFWGDGTIATSKTGVFTDWGPDRVSIQDCTFRFLYRGFYCVDTNGPARDVVIDNSFFDGGWCYLAATSSGSGGTVTYTSTVLTDTGGSLAGVAANSVVRAMAVKRAGTFTSQGAGRLIDTGANFTTAAVKRGDIVRTSTVWGIVDEVVSATVLKVEEWFNLSDYDYGTVPAASTAYTVYGLVLGKAVSATATTVTVDAWRDWDGTIATPAAGTRYEIHRAPDYQGVFALRADKITVNGNHIRRSWSDQISVNNCRHAVITGNQVYDGQDVGITIQATVPAAYQEPTVTGNKIHHEGTAGIYCSMPDARIVGNSVVEPNWMSLPASTYGGIVLDTGATGTRVQGNLVKRVSQANANKALALFGTFSRVYLDNDTVGYSALSDLTITGTTVTDVTGRFQMDTVITLASSAVGPIGDFVSSGVPVFPASAGSTCRRKGGAGASSFYVKETASSSTLWRAV